MPDQNEHPSERETLLLAYLDGELSAGERKDLEASLTEEEKAFLREEEALLQLSSASFNREEVPEKLWTRVRGEMVSGKNAKPSSLLRMRLGRWPVWSAAAAVLLLTSGAYWLSWTRRPSEGEAFMKRVAHYTVQDLQGQVSVPPDAEKLTAHLAERGLPIKVDGILMLKGETMMGGHLTRFLGATDVNVAGNACIVLLFDCCRQPIQVVLAPAASRASQAFEDLQNTQAAASEHLAQRALGKVNAFFIGQHDAKGILDLLGAAAQVQTSEKEMLPPAPSAASQERSRERHRSRLIKEHAKA